MSAISKLKTIAGNNPIVMAVYDGYLRQKRKSYETYDDDFIEFIAQKRGIGLERARELVVTAQNQFWGGWTGNAYRKFTDQALETFRPIYDDGTDPEVIATYKFHGPLDFLRMLGYLIPKAKEIEPIVSRLSSKKSVGIVDYGCGLAHRSIAVSRSLMSKGVTVKLTLVDIRKEWHGQFLHFLCTKYGIDYEFIEVSAERLYPDLPPHDYCDNVSVLEHVREPLTVVENTHRALRPGGLFLAYVDDAIEEMMHITPDLSAVRRRLRELGYTKVGRLYGVDLLQKPARS